MRSITRNLSSIGASVHQKRAILKSQLAPITFIFSGKKRFSVLIKIPKYEQDRSTNTRDSCFQTRSTFPANCNLNTSRVCCNFLLSSNSYIHTFMNRNDFWLFSDFQILALFPWLTAAVNCKFLKTTVRTALKLTAVYLQIIDNF